MALAHSFVTPLPAIYFDNSSLPPAAVDTTAEAGPWDTTPAVSAPRSSAGPERATAGQAAWLIPVIFGLITVVGAVGNSLVVYAIVRHGRMKTVTNYYIVNLAVTDISFLLCCAPFTASVFVSPDWLFGSFMCKFVFYMMQVTGQCTCLTLTAMSIDRYQAIVHPIRSLKSRTTKVACIVNACIWLGSFLISIPVAVFFGLQVTPTGEVVCAELWPLAILFPGYAIFSFLLLYVVPIVTITICYGAMLRKLWSRVSPGEQDPNTHLQSARQRRKVTRLVLAVVLVFAVCWLPIYVVQLWMRLDANFPWTEATYVFKMAAHTLSYANSSINPLVYAFMGENYRRYFRKAFPACFGPGRRGRRRGGRREVGVVGAAVASARRPAVEVASRTEHAAHFTGASAGRTVETLAVE